MHNGLESAQFDAGNLKQLVKIVLLCHLVEELDHVCEVHLVLDQHLPVLGEQSQPEEQFKMAGTAHLGGPNHFPKSECLTVDQF